MLLSSYVPNLNYRVSPISEAEILDKRVNPAGVRFASVLETIGGGVSRKAATVLRDLPGESLDPAMGAYRGWRMEEDTLVEDRVRLSMRFDIEEESLQFALSFSGEIEVIEPDELRAKGFAGALAIVSRYRSEVGCL